MRRETLVIGLVVLAVLLPMWFVAAQGEPPAEEIEIDQSVSEMQPLAGFVDAPNKLSPSQVGVIVWVALFALVGALTAAHRFMNEAVRPDDDAAAARTATDGGEASDTTAGRRDSTAGRRGPTAEHRGPTSPWLETDSRWVVAYHPASEDLRGIVVMGGLCVLAITFAALFTGEYLTLARTQYFGTYLAGLFLSLAALTVAYYAWFMPHVEVAEGRGHK